MQRRNQQSDEYLYSRMNIFASLLLLLMRYANWKGSIWVNYSHAVLFNNPLYSLHCKGGESHMSKVTEYFGCTLLMGWGWLLSVSTAEGLCSSRTNFGTGSEKHLPAVLHSALAQLMLSRSGEVISRVLLRALITSRGECTVSELKCGLISSSSSSHTWCRRNCCDWVVMQGCCHLLVSVVISQSKRPSSFCWGLPWAPW